MKLDEAKKIVEKFKPHKDVIMAGMEWVSGVGECSPALLTEAEEVVNEARKKAVEVKSYKKESDK